jgi:hypothetical protein
MHVRTRFSVVVVVVCSFNGVFAAQPSFPIRQAIDADLPG